MPKNRLILGAAALSLVVGVYLLVRSPAPDRPEQKLPDDVPMVLDAHAARDARRFAELSATARKVHERIAAAAPLFDRAPDVALTADERDDALGLFEAVLDHGVALDRIEKFHADFFRINIAGDRPRHARHFALFFAAYVEKLSLALALIDRTLNKPQFEKLFDEGHRALGIAPGAYKALKWNVVHLEDAAGPLALHQWLKLMSGPLEQLKQREPTTWGALLERLEDRYQFVKANLSKKSVQLIGGQAVDLGKDLAHAAWFPVQAEAAEVLGDTRVRRQDDPLVTAAQALEAAKLSEPGDVLVERRNWYLSNVGLPGFWPHAALYLGTHEELAAYFDDPAVTAAFGRTLGEQLAAKFPEAWASYIAPDHEGHVPRVLEAMSEGVVFTSAEHSIGTSDYVAAMRPKLSKVEKALAIERAFTYAGRPYDFDFDFYTDSSIVCSELVFKAYEPRTGATGLRLPLEKVVGRMTLGPNTIVRLFDTEAGTPAEQFTFAWFLDGHEAARFATFEGVDKFRQSHLRPKWDFVQR